MMKAAWKGAINFSLLTFMIKVYKATDASEKIQFNQLHGGKCMGRLGQGANCKACGEALTKENTVRGYEHAPDKYVVITDEDLETVKLPTNKTTEIIGFVDSREIPVAHFADPYYIGPDGPVAERSFNLFRDALLKSGKIALGRVTLSKGREEFVALTPQGRGIVLQKLYYKREVRDINALPGVTGESADKKELDLAMTLIAEMETSFEKIEVKDRYQERLVTMLEKKASGQSVSASPDATAPAQAVDILSALQASLAARTAQAPALTLVKGKAKPKRERNKVADAA